MFGKLMHYRNRIKDGRLKEFRKQLVWIYNHGKKHTFVVAVFVALGFSTTIIGLINSLVSRDLVDIVTGHKTGELIKTFVFIIATSLASVFVTQITQYISTKINLKVEQELKREVYVEIMTTEWEALSKFHSGDIMSRWGGDVSRVASGILDMVPGVLVGLFRFASSFYLVATNDVSFAIIALLGVPVSLYVSRRNLARMSDANKDNYEVSARMSAFTQESFGNTQLVKAFDMINVYIKRLKSIQDDYAKGRMNTQKLSMINAIIMTLLSTVLVYSTYGWGIYKVWSGSITYGSMTMFISLSTSLSSTLQNLISMVPNTIAIANSAQRIMDIVELPKEEYSMSDDVKAFWEANKSVGVGLAVNNAAFSYANGTEVFNDVSINAYPHEIVALVGPSGEGKTTMLRLILAIIKNQNNTDYVVAGREDADYSDLSTCSLMPLTASTRQLFAYVPQGNTMFSGTIAENMRNVKEDATDEEIVSALKMACAWEFVSKLPDGIDTMLQERGGGLSEGQAQRLSIARALIRKSPILLLDEATSALDIDTEKAVIKNILEDDYPRTTIVTTHRPSVLTVCNRVYRIHDRQCDILSQDDITRLQREFIGEE